jgi:hypothetical protein
MAVIEIILFFLNLCISLYISSFLSLLAMHKNKINFSENLFVNKADLSRMRKRRVPFSLRLSGREKGIFSQ